VLGGLGSAHAGGVLHRDIKPRNVLIAADGQVKLADFGIATSGDTENLTETGLVVGTPAYLAPERLTGSPATVRADLYSVGVMAYEALTGVQPFQGETPVAVAYAVCHGPLVPVRTRRPDVAAALDHVVSTAMARDPEQRFASASDLLDAFEAALDRPLPADPDETLQVAVLPVHKTQVLPVTAPPEPASARPPQPQPRTKSTAKTKSRSKRRRGSIVLVLATIATLVAVGALALHDRSGSASPSSPTVSTPAVVDTKPLPPALRDPFAQLAQSVQP
jgi:serine/threonine-protein kinase